MSRFLAERLGDQNVFYASRSIEPGVLFDRELLRNVWRSDALVAVIGPRWLDPKLDDPEDWVRREIVEAFAHQVRVIPLLVGSAQRLRPADLPDALAALARCQDIRLDLREADPGLERLAQAVGAGGPEPPTAPATGQSGGIGTINATTVNAVTNAQGPVHIGMTGDR